MFEGEGTCRDKTGRGSPHVAVTQKEPWMVEKLEVLFGGSTNQYEYENGEYWNWSVTGGRARGFLMTVYKFLSPHKKDRVQEALKIGDCQ